MGNFFDKQSKIPPPEGGLATLRKGHQMAKSLLPRTVDPVAAWLTLHMGERCRREHRAAKQAQLSRAEKVRRSLIVLKSTAPTRKLEGGQRAHACSRAPSVHAHPSLRAASLYCSQAPPTALWQARSTSSTTGTDHPRSSTSRCFARQGGAGSIPRASSRRSATWDRCAPPLA